MRRLIALTLLALTLIAGCLRASIWQYDRYQHRHAQNALIQSNIDRPEISESDLSLFATKPREIAWRTIRISGHFLPASEFLVRNRYNDGVYGFGVVTLFQSDGKKSYWVDRGWVQAGKDAKTAPITQRVTDQPITITGRVRLDSIEHSVGGTFFALPSSFGKSEIAQWNNEQKIKTEPVYFDLISASSSEITPTHPTLLPELSDGPHLAYSFQWLLFAGFVIFGWFIVLREDRRSQRAKA